MPTNELITISSSEIKGLKSTLSVSFFGAYKDAIVELVPGYIESSSSSESSESSSSSSSESSLSTWRIGSTESSESSVSNLASSSSSISSLNSTSSFPCIEPEQYCGPLHVWSDRGESCSDEYPEWCIEGPEGNYNYWDGLSPPRWESENTVGEFDPEDLSRVSEYLLYFDSPSATWYLLQWAFNPHSTEPMGEYAAALAAFDGSSTSGPYGIGTPIYSGDTSYYVISTISPCFAVEISESGSASLDGTYLQYDYSENGAPIFRNTSNFTIQYIGGWTCGGKWILGLGSTTSYYAEWVQDITDPPSGIADAVYLGVSEDIYAGGSWNHCPG